VVSLAESPDAIRIAVADDGMGIPADDLPHVFDRFHRAKNVTGRVSGIGLGLTSVRRAVEAHGGSVEVESVEGEGATFTIHLPRR
jgi:signal transduction histidine kinase